MKHIYLLLILPLFTASTDAVGQLIEGPSNVCPDECYIFRLTEEISDLNWQVVDDQGDDVPFTILGDSSSIEVCFPANGNFVINATTGGQPHPVTASDFSSLILEYRGCQTQWLENQFCAKICGNQTITLHTVNLNPEQTNWNIFGNGQLISSTPSSVTLQLGPTGNVNIGYFGQLENGRCIFEGGACIEILPQPEASFSADPPMVNDTIRVCRGQSVRFENTSEAPTRRWTLTGQNSAEGESVTYRFNDPGTFELVQTVGTSCDCEAETSAIIEVQSDPGPVIECLSSVCSGDTAIYRTQAGCAPYQWSVSAEGSIAEGGSANDDFVAVIWTSGSEGTVTLEHACADQCPIPTEETIYILGDDTQIEGRTQICPGQTYTYKVPPHDGTDIQWTTHNGTIQSGQGSPLIKASFNAGGDDPYVAVQMEDCTRGCSQADTLWLQRTNPFSIEGPNAMCFGASGTWTTVSEGNPIASGWKLVGPEGAIIDSSSSPTPNFNFSFGESGTFLLEARPENDIYCFASQQITITVRDSVPELLPINGADTVCPNQIYTYSVAQGVVAPYRVEWIAVEGSDTTFYSGSSIQHQWEQPQGGALTAYILDQTTGCTGAAYHLYIERVGAIDITGPVRACHGTEEIYHLQGAPSADIQWSLSDPLQANILQSAGDSVRLLFTRPGPVELQAEVCGEMTSYPIQVQAAPEIDTDPLEKGSCNSRFVSKSISGVEYDSIWWYLNGDLFSTFDEAVFPPGQKNMVVIKDSLGCVGRASFSIPHLRVPEPKITALSVPYFCNGGNLTLIHNLDDTAGMQIRWYSTDSLLAENRDSIQVTEAGRYYLEVDYGDANCTLRSKGLSICDFCDPGAALICDFDGGGMNINCDPSLGSLNATAMSLPSCDRDEFQVSHPDLIPGSGVWSYEYEGSVTRVQGDSVRLNFTSPGIHYVAVTGMGLNSQGDTAQFCHEGLVVEVDGVLALEGEVACYGDSTHFFPFVWMDRGVNVTDYSWEFDDPVSGVANTSSEENPGHVYAAPGTYEATLEVNASSGCSLSDNAEVTVAAPPEIELDPDTVQCTHQAFSIQADSTAEFYAWKFGGPLPDTPQSFQNPGNYTFANPGTQEIRLEVEDLLGCRNDSTIQVDVNEYTGADSIEIQPSLPACEGDWVELFVPGGPADYLWSNGRDSSHILADASGRYRVTVTDGEGCRAELCPVEVAYDPAPNAAIFAYAPGGASSYSGDTLEICVGQSAILQPGEMRSEYTYEWSNGLTSETLRYDGEERQKLNPGIHEYNLTVTDQNSGCAADAQYFVRVHPRPQPPIIEADQPQPVCEGTPTELSIQNPLPELQYQWNRGFGGPSITVSTAGSYQVLAENQWGCTATSTPFEIHPRPNTNLFPQGCLEECGRTEICIPLAEGDALSAWYRNGSSLSVPNDPGGVEIDSSGSYHAEITNAFGCTAETDPIEFEIAHNSGTIEGIVFLDLDEDGLFSPGDSLVENLLIQLIRDSTVLDSSLTNSDGEYTFEVGLFSDYQLVLVPGQLPAQWIIERGSDSVRIEDCGDNVTALPLILRNCAATTDSVVTEACAGDSIEVEGQYYFLDTTFSILEQGVACPDTTIYELTFFSRSDSSFQTLSTCTGDTIITHGEAFFSDTVLVFEHQNINGCDSVEVIELEFDSMPVEQRDFTLCPGDSVEVNGTFYAADTSFQFVDSTAQPDCPVTVEVSIAIGEPWTATVDTNPACAGQSNGSAEISLQGIDRGDIQTIELDGAPQGGFSLDNLMEGQYELLLKDQNGCEWRENLEIAVRPPLEVSIPEVTMNCADERAVVALEILSGDTAGLQILWETGAMGRQAAVSALGSYAVEISTECEQMSLEAMVIPEEEEEAFQVFVPNIFSPNNDGINDEFQPEFGRPESVRDYRLEVFDRWGNRVFVSHSPFTGWDGTYKGRPAAPGTYVYILEWETVSCETRQEVQKSGSVGVVR